MNDHFLTDIAIKRFKCFTRFNAEGLKRVNLIGGKNNVGKTAFMEGCYINVCSISIDCLITAILTVKLMRESINLLQKDYNYKSLLDATRIFDADSNIYNTTLLKKKTPEKRIKLISIITHPSLAQMNLILI